MKLHIEALEKGGRPRPPKGGSDEGEGDDGD